MTFWLLQVASEFNLTNLLVFCWIWNHESDFLQIFHHSSVSSHSTHIKDAFPEPYFMDQKKFKFLNIEALSSSKQICLCFRRIWNHWPFVPKLTITLKFNDTQLLWKFSAQAVYPLDKKMKSISKFWYSRLLKTNSPNFLVEFKTTNYFLPRLCITLQFHDTQHLWTFSGQAIYSLHKSSKRNSKFWASCQLGTNSPIFFAKFGTTNQFLPKPSITLQFDDTQLQWKFSVQAHYALHQTSMKPACVMKLRSDAKFNQKLNCGF